MIAIVTGGRAMDGREWQARVLNDYDITVLKHGACPGTKGRLGGSDYLADWWARDRGIRREPFPPDWDKWGHRAGPKRNREMAQSGADICIAFPGGRGTDSCILECMDAGIKVERHAYPGDAYAALMRIGPGGKVRGPGRPNIDVIAAFDCGLLELVHGRLSWWLRPSLSGCDQLGCEWTAISDDPSWRVLRWRT